MASLPHGEEPGDGQDIRLVVDTIPTLAWSAGPDGSADFFNQRWLDYTGLSAEQALGSGWQVAIHPDDLQRILEIFREALNSGKPYEVEGRFRRFDGEFRWFLFRGSPLHDRSGKVAKWYGTNTDLEERKRAEDALRKSEERWRSVFENSAIGVALTDLNGRFLATNRVFQVMVGYTEEELRDITFLDVTHEDYREANWALITELVERKRQQFQIEKKYRRKDGSLIWVSSNVSLVLGTEMVPRFVMALSEDITERKRAEEALQRSEGYLAEAQKLTHTGSWAAQVYQMENVSWSNFYWSEELYRIFGFDPDPTPPSEAEIVGRLHPDDVLCNIPVVEQAIRGRSDFEVDYRLVLPNGAVKHIHVVGHPVVNASGDVIELVGTAMDVTERKRAEEKLQRSEAFLAQGQTLSHTGSFGWSVLSGEIYWSEETYNIFQYDQAVKPTLELVFQRIHPDDRDRVQQARDRASETGTDFDLENRLLMADGSVKYIHVIGRALKTSAETLEFVGAVTDVTAAKQAEEELRQREADLLEAQRLSHTGSLKHDISSGRVTVSPEVYRIYGVRPDEAESNAEFWLNRTHPEDAKRIRELFEECEIQKTDYEADHRIVLPDGTLKHLHAIGHPIVNEKGDLVEFVGTVMDVTASKQAEEKIRQSDSELRQILELAPQHVYVLGPDPDRTNQSLPALIGRRVYANQAALDYLGLTFEEWQTVPRRLSHPDDWARVMSEAQRNFSSGLPHETELRLPRNDGQYRWFLFRWNPIRDDQGRVTRWYVAGTDIEDRKRAEERMRDENLALREQIDQAFMFEEIVGTSPALQGVLSRIMKVAPTDSSVLVIGETGTGKELVARAIHKRSRRSQRAFVSVNCAALAPSLISSELFGHEKGAFTGALQRRVGRFELANGGTIFLDEIGEVPLDTQVALLRVLQEREFERVGGTQPVKIDVRIIAATNRDLEAAVANGTFRSDLYYRLNVFPIQIPPLRERQDDLLMLLEYFVQRFAQKMGKHFKKIDKRTFELFRSYPWPGNIRELQNVVERSVIVSSDGVFSVDAAWLSKDSRRVSLPQQPKPVDTDEDASRERQIIEDALAGSRGRVSGPDGAAARLRVSPSTLEYRIKKLRIRKSPFKLS